MKVVSQPGLVVHVAARPFGNDEQDWWAVRDLLAQSCRRGTRLELGHLGARTACIDAGDDVAANALYVACGFSEEYESRLWRFRSATLAP